MRNKIALLWDESFLWGLMAYEALKKTCLPFELITSEEIKKGLLLNYNILFVPGGWASNKLKTIGIEGAEEIRSFVKKGGAYLGICGGAGLATLDGIGLLKVKRRPTKDRVPSFSGRIRLDITPHPIWSGFDQKDKDNLHEPIFYAWWPSQFVVDDGLNVLATYGMPLSDSFTSDLCIGDLNYCKVDWSELESSYGINLNPNRLYGEPAVIEGVLGSGRVILSLIHFDTPDHEGGYLVLRNLCQYFLGSDLTAASSSEEHKRFSVKFDPQIGPLIEDIYKSVAELIDLGIRNFLWFPRNSMLFQWRRGIRGLEYCNLYILVKKIYEFLTIKKIDLHSEEHLFIEISFDEEIKGIKEPLTLFCEKAKELIILERLALQKRNLTFEKSDDPKIQNIRLELFSSSKSYGGLYKELIDKIDKVLYKFLKLERGSL
ncbi:MAG: BPL-N domain-containing protein [Thermodesulfovibrionales bacterium]|nr:BPL-N domain-containing protein [Thermodesulfovibrionales bacterium]